jgi:two-component system response regulator PilR (NtrC family)
METLGGPEMSVRVLLVDDQPEILEVLELLYSMVSGLKIVGKARNISEAKECLRRQEVDVISIDIFLGRENGFDLCQFVTEAMPHIFITMCSSEGSADNRRTAQLYGARFFLEKPVKVENLTDLVGAYHQFAESLSELASGGGSS